MWSDPKLSVKSSILNAIDTILLSLLFGLLIGIIYMVLTTCFPKPMVYLAFIGTFIVLMFAGIFILVKPVQFFSPNVWNILLGVAFILAAITFLVYMVCYKK
jgi:xanthosine utilization system XapX-like protein